MEATSGRSRGRLCTQDQTRLQNRLFIKQHEKMKQDPDKPAVFQQSYVPEEQSLAEDSAHHRHVHRIPYITIESRHNQVACRKDWRRRAQPLRRESEE